MGCLTYANARCFNHGTAFLPEKLPVGVGCNEQRRLTIAKISSIQLAINAHRRAKFSGAVGE